LLFLAIFNLSSFPSFFDKRPHAIIPRFSHLNQTMS
jgi:hypothetical protein